MKASNKDGSWIHFSKASEVTGLSSFHISLLLQQAGKRIRTLKTLNKDRSSTWHYIRTEDLLAYIAMLAASGQTTAQ